MLAFDGPLLHIQRMNLIIVVLRSEVLQSRRLVVVMVLVVLVHRYCEPILQCTGCLPLSSLHLHTLQIGAIDGVLLLSFLKVVRFRSKPTDPFHALVRSSAWRLRANPVSTPMAGTIGLATAIRPHLFAADFSTGAFITTPVGDVAAPALASLSSLRGKVTLPSPWAQQGNVSSIPKMLL